MMCTLHNKPRTGNRVEPSAHHFLAEGSDKRLSTQYLRPNIQPIYQRLIKPLVQELDGTLPGNVSSLSVILRAILLEEPMFGPWIRIDGDRPPCSLELLLHLGDRPSRLEGV